MRKRLLIIGIALVLAACAVTGGVVATSSATYAAASSSTASASVAGVSDFLHLYSQTSPDPEGLTGYYNQAGVVPTTLAATGTDGTLTVNLGKQPNINTVEARVFTIKAASTAAQRSHVHNGGDLRYERSHQRHQPERLRHRAGHDPHRDGDTDRRAEDAVQPPDERTQVDRDRAHAEPGHQGHVQRLHRDHVHVHRSREGDLQLAGASALPGRHQGASPGAIRQPASSSRPWRRSASMSWSRWSGVVSGLMIVTRRAPTPSRLDGTM